LLKCYHSGGTLRSPLHCVVRANGLLDRYHSVVQLQT
jgi:hypothetical protein